MNFNESERAAGRLTVASIHAVCSGSTHRSPTHVDCNRNGKGPAPAVHVWEGHSYCAFHSPFDLTEADRDAQRREADSDITQAISDAKIDICTKVDMPTLAAHFDMIEFTEDDGQNRAMIYSAYNPFSHN